MGIKDVNQIMRGRSEHIRDLQKRVDTHDQCLMRKDCKHQHKHARPRAPKSAHTHSQGQRYQTVNTNNRPRSDKKTVRGLGIGAPKAEAIHMLGAIEKGEIVTVLKTNKDGSVKIKTHKGVEKNINKYEFRKYFKLRSRRRLSAEAPNKEHIRLLRRIRHSLQ